jgi:hypothetical protein
VLARRLCIAAVGEHAAPVEVGAGQPATGPVTVELTL